MAKRDLSSTSTLALIAAFVERTKELDQLINARWYNIGLSWKRPRAFWERLIHDKLNGLVEELCLRYRGIMYQIFRRAGVNHGQLDTTVTNVWVSVQQGVITMTDEREFSKMLWKECMTMVPSSAPAECLKPKFMLRQFIDEIPPCDERGVLRALAYDSPPGVKASQFGGDIDRQLSKAYELLHGQVLEYTQDDLNVFTDGTIFRTMFFDLDALHREYQQWLFV